MAGPKMKFSLKTPELMKNFMNEQLANSVGAELVNGSKDLIARGLSPVRGVGRFEDYKDSAKYPNKKKPARPVNLSLTGRMLSFLNFYRRGNSIWFGIVNAPPKVQTIARVHNTGERSDIPQRQFIPEDGQEFVVSIMVKVKELYRKRVLEIIRSSKK